MTRSNSRSPLDELPQRPSSHDLGDLAIAKLRQSVEAAGLFLFRTFPSSDYGADVELEVRDGAAVTGFGCRVQVKGINGEQAGDGSVRVSLRRTNLNYLLAGPLSVYVCYHQPTQRLLARFAQDVYREYEHKGDDWRTQETVTVTFRELFDAGFQQRLHDILLHSGRAERDQRLVWAATSPESALTILRSSLPTIHVPPNPEEARRLLRELYRSGRDREISCAFEQFLAVLVDDPQAVLDLLLAEVNLGVNGAQFSSDRVKGAITLLEAAAISDGQGSVESLYYCLGNAHLALRDYSSAIENFELALKSINVSDAGLKSMCLKNLGSALEGRGEIDAARALYVLALQMDSDHAEAHFALALWQLRYGSDPADALTHLNSVYSRTGSAVRMSSVLGWRINAHLRLGSFELALADISALLDSESRPDWAWNWCARQVSEFTRTCNSLLEPAVRFWRRFLVEHPGDVAARRELLLTQWKLHHEGMPIELSFESFREEALALASADEATAALLWDRVGHWAQRENDWRQAEIAYREAYRLEPSNYAYCFSTALNFLKRFDESLEILSTLAAQEEPDAMTWFQLAIANEGIGDLENAVVSYGRAIELDEKYDLAWFNLGGIHWNRGQIARARKVWSEAIRRFPTHELASAAKRFLDLH